MRFKVGDLVRNTHESHAQKEGLGIVLHINTDKYKQLKVVTPNGITYWWPAVVGVVDESR